jgi:hypothetical protein
MPSIESNRKAAQTAIEKGQLVRVDPAAIAIAPPTPPLTNTNQSNAYLRTPLPASYVQQPDQQRSWQAWGVVPQQRVPPLPAASNANVGGQSSSQSTTALSQALPGVVGTGGNAGFVSPATLDNVANSGTYSKVLTTPATGLNTLTAVAASGNILLKNVAQATPSTSGPTTASGTYAVIPEMTITVTTKGNDILLLFSIVLASSVPGYQYAMAFFRDGAMIGPEFDGGNTMTAGNFLQIPFAQSFLDNTAAAGSHTYDVRWKATSGTVVSVALQRTFQLVELG